MHANAGVVQGKFPRGTGQPRGTGACPLTLGAHACVDLGIKGGACLGRMKLLRLPQGRLGSGQCRAAVESLFNQGVQSGRPQAAPPCGIHHCMHLERLRVSQGCRSRSRLRRHGRGGVAGCVGRRRTFEIRTRCTTGQQPGKKQGHHGLHIQAECLGAYRFAVEGWGSSVHICVPRKACEGQGRRCSRVNRSCVLHLLPRG